MKQHPVKYGYTFWVAYHEAAHFVTYVYHFYLLGIEPEIIEVSIETPNGPLSFGGFTAEPFLKMKDFKEMASNDNDPRQPLLECMLKQLLAGIVIDYSEEKRHRNPRSKWQFLKSKTKLAVNGDDIIQVLDILSILEGNDPQGDYSHRLKKFKNLLLNLMDEVEMELGLLKESLDYVSQALIAQGTIRGENLIPLVNHVIETVIKMKFQEYFADN